MKSNNTLRVKALFLLAVYGIQLSLPALSFSSGNNSRSMESNGPAGGSELVNLYTGDFSYSIPLMSVDGFPISLSYSSNIGMHQEASWVGLGWSLNTGAINRDKRGIPDDFDGDVIAKTTSSATDSYISSETGKGLAISNPSIFKEPFSFFGGLSLELKKGMIVHDYLGQGNLFDIGVSSNLYKRMSGTFNPGAVARLGLSFNGLQGVTTNASVGYGISSDPKSNTETGLDITKGEGRIFNTRQGRMTYDYFSTSASVEMKKWIGGIGYSATVRTSGLKNFAPNITNNSSIGGFSSRLTLGVLFGVGNLYFTVYGLTEKAESNNIPNSETISPKAFGYFNLQNANYSNGDITDYNRENSHVINRSIQILPMSQLTYDLYYIQSPFGTSSFRAFRNDIGTISTEKKSAKGNVPNVNVYGAYGSFIDYFFSAGLGVTNSNTTSELWNNGSDNHKNNSISKLYFKNAGSEDEKSNTFYYKITGEPSKLNMSFFDQYGGFDLSRIPISTSSNGRGIATEYINSRDCPTCPESVQALPMGNANHGKNMVQTQIHSLTAKQSSEVGIESQIKSFSANTLPQGNFTITNKNRLTSAKKAHHVSEYILTDASGNRQIFNIPVYSIQEKSVVFNISGNSPDGRKQVSYTAGTDNSTSNNKGLDRLFTSTVTPGYATSYLLRAMISSDYYDRTNDGMTEDDYGSYIKINHTCIYDEANPFKWRSPYSSPNPGSGGYPKAMYLENLKSYQDDNYGAYEYGLKELWYTHSIEGKEHIALFYLDNRDDMFSVLGEDGGMDQTKPGKLLKKIVLFSKEDLVKHGANAEPLQTVEFIYDYSLCKGFDGNKNSANNDNTSGKLTLKKIFINTSRSKEGQESKFEFVYNEGNFNYNPIHADRWGFYNNTSFAGLDNFDFPYVDQGLPSDDSRFSAWNLTEIILPGGGKIAVEYESDDYAFVEDHSSMLFTSVTKMGHVDEKSAHATLANSNFAKDPTSKKPHNVVYFRLPEAITAATLAEGKDKLYDRYLKPIYEEHDGKLYYNYLVKVRDESGSPEEWISGYCQVENAADFHNYSYGLIGNSPYQEAWITLRDEPVQDNVNNSYSTNPIMNLAWQFMRLSAPRNLFGNNSAFNGIDVASITKAINKVLYNKKICRSFIPEKSCIRIGANRKKKGGGSRVKKILFYDNFNTMTGNKEIGSVYGFEYEYLLKDGGSSGVASYEPLIGNNENPLKKGQEFKIIREKLPDEKHYHFSPIGEQFYEGSLVGYSRVKVKSISYSGVERNTTGYTIHEYFTSKDEPVVNSATYMTPSLVEQNDKFLDGVLMNERVSTAIMTQGFLINKVHIAGKPRKVSSFNNGGLEIGSTDFKYSYREPIKTIKQDGTTEMSYLNREVDFFADAFSTLVTNKTIFAQAGAGLKKGKLTVSAFGGANRSFEGYYFSTFTKVIEDYPILESVTSHFQGAKTTSINLAWDAHTGQPLVTKSLNDHNQSIYSVEYPSHWAYPNAKPKYLGADNHAENITITSGVANLSGTGYNSADLFNVGDQVMITNSSGVNSLAWVSFMSTTTITLVDRTGTKLTTTSSGNTLRVLAPNTKADPSTPMMSYITLDNPIGVSSLNAPSGILSAGALSLKDCWATASAYNYGCTTTASGCGTLNGAAINPWVTGVSGNLRPNKFFTYQVDRAENSVSATPEVDLRSGGKYNAFIPFYAYSSGAGRYVPIDHPSHPNYNAGLLEKWLLASQIINYNEHGVPIESKDVLGNYSGVVFGYSNTLKVLPVASAEFARYTDIAFDGFEDYLFRSDVASCSNLDGHFDFKKVVSLSDLSSAEYHTGRFSLKVASGANFTVGRKIFTVSDDVSCSTAEDDKGQFSANSGQNLKGFSPRNGLYQFSIWAKQNTNDLYMAVPDAKIEIKVSYPSGDTTTVLGATESPIIEGWQKIEGTFRVSPAATCVTVKLYHSATTAGNVFFDDLRIHPHNSNMISVVYDPFTLRSWAVLDDRNYATIYEYDENGMVVRVKRETIDGIKTIAESRKSLKK